MTLGRLACSVPLPVVAIGAIREPLDHPVLLRDLGRRAAGAIVPGLVTALLVVAWRLG